MYRSTFYLHYLSIDDLLYETLEMINKRFHNTFNNKTIDINKATKNSLFLINDDYLIPYLNFIKENKKIYKLIHDKPYIFQSNIALKNMYDEIFDKILDKYNVPIEEKDYLFSYYSFGLVAIIQKWIDKDCKDDILLISNLMKKVVGYEKK